jgi:hypothetical protein
VLLDRFCRLPRLVRLGYLRRRYPLTFEVTLWPKKSQYDRSISKLGVCNQKLRDRPQWSTVVEMCISHRSDDDPRSRLQVQPKLNGQGRDFQIRAVGPCPQTRVRRLELCSSLIWPS